MEPVDSKGNSPSVANESTHIPAPVEGWLKKKTFHSKNVFGSQWKKRFFKQIGTILHYFEEIYTATEANQKGFVDLNEIESIHIVSDTHFNLVTKDSEYQLQVFQKEPQETFYQVQQYWIDGLSRSISYYFKRKLNIVIETEGVSAKLQKKVSSITKRLKGDGLPATDSDIIDPEKKHDLSSSPPSQLLGTPTETKKPSNWEKLQATVTAKRNSFSMLASRNSRESIDLPGSTPTPVLTNSKEDTTSLVSIDSKLETTSSNSSAPELSRSEQASPSSSSEQVPEVTPVNTESHSSEDLRQPSLLLTQRKRNAISTRVSLDITPKDPIPSPEPQPASPKLEAKTEKVDLPPNPLPSPPLVSVSWKKEIFGGFGAYFLGAAFLLFVILRFSWTLLLGFLLGIFLTIGAIAFAAIYVFSAPKTDNSKPLFNIDLNKTPPEAPSGLPFPLNLASGDSSASHVAFFNHLLGKAFLEHITSDKFMQKYIQKLNDKLANAKRPDYVGELKISAIDFGKNTFQIVKSVQILKPLPGEELRAEFDLLYSGPSPPRVTLSITAYINWPKERMYTVPLSLSVTVTQVEGRTLVIMPTGPDPLCTVSFSSPPVSKFIVENSVGGKNQLKNIPKVSDFVAKKLRKYIERELVTPNGICFHIPIKGARPLKPLLLTRWRKRNNYTLEPDPAAPNPFSRGDYVAIPEVLSPSPSVSNNNSLTSSTTASSPPEQKKDVHNNAIADSK